MYLCIMCTFPNANKNSLMENIFDKKKSRKKVHMTEYEIQINLQVKFDTNLASVRQMYLYTNKKPINIVLHFSSEIQIICPEGIE